MPDMFERSQPHEGGFRSLVFVRSSGSQSVEAAAGGSVGQLHSEKIVAQEPVVCHPCRPSISFHPRNRVGGLRRQQSSRRLDRLLVEQTSWAAPGPPSVADRRECPFSRRLRRNQPVEHVAADSNGSFVFQPLPWHDQ